MFRPHKPGGGWLARDVLNWHEWTPLRDLKATLYSRYARKRAIAGARNRRFQRGASARIIRYRHLRRRHGMRRF